eukprot:TRINITY_DN9397_c0_g1_i1.p2 TRINITY_DN9397_c0_g1~~TRINITY_DN9397_c0_g1_i1.p2  ORF type:complete len:103 (-),score=14.96 TRINITY_DN9397_c0_g1_i1:172-480(-)
MAVVDNVVTSSNELVLFVDDKLVVVSNIVHVEVLSYLEDTPAAFVDTSNDTLPEPKILPDTEIETVGGENGANDAVTSPNNDASEPSTLIGDNDIECKNDGD